MSRIRTIKPEFWTSAQVLECSTNARLLFIGLWNFCDDLGRHPLNPKQVKAEVFPSDSFSEKQMAGMLQELSTNGLIVPYESGGIDYFYIPGWKHQRIDKPQPAKYPDPLSEDSKSIPRTFPPDTIGYDRKGNDSIGRADALDTDFEKLREVYPKRKGGDPRKSAFEKFSALVRAGADPQDIIAAARDGVGFDREKAGTEFIPQLVKWLRDERFRDRPRPLKVQPPSGFYVVPDTPQMDAWIVYERTTRRSYPRDRNGGWYFPSEYPPSEDQLPAGQVVRPGSAVELERCG